MFVSYHTTYSNVKQFNTTYYRILYWVIECTVGYFNVMSYDKL